MPLLRQLVCLGLTAACLLGCAHSGKGSDSEKPQYTITLKVAEQLKKVGELAQDKKWAEALAALDRIAEHKYLNPYERAMLWSARAGIHFAMNKTDEVVKDMEQAVAPHAMPEAQQLDAEFNLAEAYFTAERFSESADAFAKWEKRAKSPTPDNYYLIASAFAQAHRFAEGLPYAKKAVAGMKEPKEPWLQLLLSLHYELKQDPQVAAVLERLVASFPKKEYWLQLSATYEAMGKEDKALATLETANGKGLLTEEKDLVNLARMYLRAGAALKGAALLDKQMSAGKVSKSPENLDLLATCWVAGKDVEHAEAVLARAGDGVGSGNLYQEIGRLELVRGKWTKARDALSKAFQLGGLKAAGEAHLLLGIAHYKTKRKDAALASLGEAKKDKASAQCADEWIKAVKSSHSAVSPACSLGGAP